MFYRQYRPKNFAELVGLEGFSKTILSAVQNHKVPHAYLFFGSRGTGKTTMARLVAKALNCDNLTTDVCGVCPSCIAIEEGKFLDLIEIDAASNRGIEDIRSLKEKISLAPTHKKCKVYIIDEVHMLTTDAFNALLKTLEEPPTNVYFILCTTDPQKVLDTIKSRCVKFEFKRASEAGIVKKLSVILATEYRTVLGSPESEVKRRMTETELRKIAKAAVGGFRDAETLLEQVIISNLSVDEVLSSSGNLMYDEFADALSSADGKICIDIINKAFSSGVDLSNWTMGLLEYLRYLLLITLKSNRAVFNVADDKYEVMKVQAQNFSSEKILSLLELFNEAVNKIKDATIPVLSLEVAVAKYILCHSGKPEGRVQNQFLNKQILESSSPTAKGGGTPPQNDEKPKSIQNPQPSQAVSLDWEGVLNAVKPFNHSVEGLLRGCRMVGFDGDRLTIEAFYSFHKERLESPRNRQVLESALKEFTGREVAVHFKLGQKAQTKEDLSDKNIAEPKKEEVKEVAKNVAEVFDGEIEV